MDRNRKLLLNGLIFGVLITILLTVFSSLFESIVSNSNVNVEIANSKALDTANLVLYGLYFTGIIYFLVLIFNKNIDLNKHRTGILIYSIIFLIINVITGVFGIIVVSDLKKEKKRELPVIEEKEFTNKYVCLIAFILCMFLMFFVSRYTKTFYQSLLIYVAVLALMLGVFYKQLIHDAKIFKEYFKEYMSLSFKTWLKSLVTMMIVGIIIQLVTNTTQANNQKTLQTLFNHSPLIIAALSMIYAPIAEELMFRGVFRKFLKNKYAFIIISGVLFGLLHVIDDSKTLAEFSYILLYSTLGIYLSSLYYKTNNLFSNISFHFFQNTLGVIGMILLYFMK